MAGPTLLPGGHAIVTGGSSGLGLELARRLAARGMRLTLVARDAQKLATAALELGGDTQTLAVDVRDAAAVEAAFASLAPADLLVNNAGVMREGRFAQLDPAAFTDVMDINFHGAVHVCRATLPGLVARRGRIVNVASVAGLTGVYGYTPYCAAKHALVGFTEALRHELRPDAVRVHLACPGEFDSPLVDALDATRSPQNRAHTLTIPKLPVAVIADEIVAGIERDRDVIIPGRRTRLLVLGQRLAPGIARRIADRRIATA